MRKVSEMAEFDDTFATPTLSLNLDTSQAQRSMENLERLSRRFSTTLTRAFVDLAVKGKGLDDVFRSLALSLSQLVLKAALRPLTDALGGLLGNVAAGGLGFAKGGVLHNQLPVPFAQGGVVRSPVTFPLADGRIGLAGERGAEAILPLARGPDGRLGVAAQSGGAMSVTFNVSTPDADSFRRSESQLAAMVARAVALGQRNL
jgi:phage-related minor tail protein